MNINTLIDALSAAVAQDASLAAWCQATYENGVTVFVSMDERNPPGADQLPCVVIYPAEKSVSDTRAHRVVVECWIQDESLRDRAIANIIEYAGTSRVEEMRKLAETAISAVDLGNTELEEAQIEYDTVSHFPMFFAGMALTFTSLVLIGEDQLA